MFRKILVLFEDPEVHEKLMTIKLSYSQLTKCPELKENPFRKRICKIFSTDSSGDLTFNDFLFLFSRLNIYFKFQGDIYVLAYFSISVFVRGHQEILNCIMHSAFMTLMGTILLVLVILNRFYFYSIHCL